MAPTWTGMHRTVGEFLVAANIASVILVAIAYTQYGRRSGWALVGFPFILYWDVMWLMGHFTAILQ
jgi:hypothetical protein